MRLHKPLLLAIALGTMHPSFAMQLGTSKSTAVFGRILDLSIPIRLDSKQENVSHCFSADVFQADNKFDVGRVRIDVSPSANGLDAVLRLRSVTTITEPWAKVILRSSCGTTVSRQYDFLTDFASESPADNSLTGNLLTQSALALSTTLAKTDVLPQKTSTASAQTRQPAAKKIKLSPPDAKAINKPMMASAVPAAAPATGQSRLKVEAFELADERQVLLKLSSALTIPTGVGVGTRTAEEVKALAQASAVWRVMNDLPPEVKAPTTSVATENQAKPPVAAITATSSAPSLIDQKLADKSEFSNLLVYGLVGLLALTLGCIAWLWLRVRKAARASYDWLNPEGDDDINAGHDRTQFLPTIFHEPAAAEEQEEPELEVAPSLEPEPDLKPGLKPVLEPVVATSTESQVKVEPISESTHTWTSFEDVDLAKAPLKLHAITAPEPVKEEVKSNMIDFDIFADALITEKSAKPGRKSGR
jgi:hypothetical protein